LTGLGLSRINWGVMILGNNRLSLAKALLLSSVAAGL
jgi:hypothetical protein